MSCGLFARNFNKRHRKRKGVELRDIKLRGLWFLFNDEASGGGCVEQINSKGMNRLILILLCAFAPLRLCAAVGDMIGLEVETNGWVLRATISGLNTNGIFYSGLRTNGTPSLTNNLTLSVTGTGYNSALSQVSVGRTLYTTKHLRLPYPLEQTNDFQAQGSDVVIRLALSEYVCAGDTVTATARAGYYAVTNGSGTNAAAFTAQTVTNSSTQISPAPFGKWALVPMQQITNNTMRVKSSDWHWAARDGKPVAAVKYTAIDEHSNTNSVTVTSMTWDAGLRAAVYMADMDISTFTNGSKIQVSRTVYPWIGTNLFTTTNGAHITSPFYNLTNLCDRTRQFGNSYAVVDPANGSANGVVVSHTNWNPNAVPVPFLTIDAALVAGKLSNSIWFGHLDTAGVIVMLTNGSHLYTGASGSLGTNGRTHTIITRHPSAGKMETIIGNQSGNAAAGYWVTIRGLNITNNSALNYWNNGGFVWWDDCLINATVNVSGAFQWGENPQFVTSCVISNNPQGWRGSGARSAPCPLFAGNDVGVPQQGDAYAVIGNNFQNQTTIGWADTHSSSPDPDANGGIFYNNRTFRANPTSQTIGLGQTNRIGFAFVNNTHEATNSSGIALAIYSDGNTNPATQILLWNNVILGQRLNYNYNDSQVTGVQRYFFSLQGNFFDDYNIKSDTFNSSPAPSGNRIGNWASLYGVMQRNNVKAETPNIGASGFLNTTINGFEGLFTWASVTDTNWPAFRNRLAYDGAGARLGTGDYRLRQTSPMWGTEGLRLISHDFDATPRGLFDPPGAFATGNAKKGGFF